jgi:hypothetical protein
MFGEKDKLTLTAQFFHIKEGEYLKEDISGRLTQGELVLSLPLSDEEIRDLVIPENLNMAAIIEYHSISGTIICATPFNIYVGEEISGNDLAKSFSSFETGAAFIKQLDSENAYYEKHGRYPFKQKSVWDRRYYYIVDEQGRKNLVGSINDNDKVVPNIFALKGMLILISRDFAQIKESKEAIKNLSLVPKENK